MMHRRPGRPCATRRGLALQLVHACIWIPKHSNTKRLTAWWTPFALILVVRVRFFPHLLCFIFSFFLISRSSYVDEGCAMRVFHAKINSNKGRAESNCMMLVRMLERCVKGHRFFFIIEFAFSKYVGNWEKYHDLIFFSPCKNSTQFAQARLICIEEFFSSFSLMINLRKM